MEGGEVFRVLIGDLRLVAMAEVDGGAKHAKVRDGEAFWFRLVGVIGYGRGEISRKDSRSKSGSFMFFMRGV